MAKRRKASPGPDKCRAAARARAERNRDSWDFPVKLPIAPAEVLAEITPYPPDWCLDRGQLTSSPARVLAEMASQPGPLPDAADLICRWPFRIARPGESAGPWLCLALIAYERGIDVTEAARATCELEDNQLLVWSSDHNVYVFGQEVAGVRGDDDQSRELLDSVFEKIERESAVERGQRKWTRPQVIARPAED